MKAQGAALGAGPTRNTKPQRGDPKTAQIVSCVADFVKCFARG